MLPDDYSIHIGTDGTLELIAQFETNIKQKPEDEGENNNDRCLAFRQFLFRGKLSDVLIAVGNGKDEEEHIFKGHRVILAARSDYFATMLRGDFREGQSFADGESVIIKIVGFSESTVRALLEYIYTGGVDQYTPETAETRRELLRIADQYRLERLCELACRFIILRELDISTVLSLLSLGTKVIRDKSFKIWMQEAERDLIAEYLLMGE